MQVAKIFENGGSQAVRLPKNFKLSGKEVSVSHLGHGVLLQPINRSWLDVYHAIKPDPHFMDERDDAPPEEREPL